jgi:hypothetical protein
LSESGVFLMAFNNEKDKKDKKMSKMTKKDKNAGQQ